MNILLIGAGRMGCRHLLGLNQITDEIHIVDPKASERDIRRIAGEYGLQATLRFHVSLDSVAFNQLRFFAAIIATSARGRLDVFRAVAQNGIVNILLEKPLEQSRKRFREILEVARDCHCRVHCNHSRRSLPFFADLRERGGPFQLTVSGGAFGFGCNGCHWIDFALYLSRARAGKLLLGEIDREKIASSGFVVAESSIQGA